MYNLRENKGHFALLNEATQFMLNIMNQTEEKEKIVVKGKEEEDITMNTQPTTREGQIIGEILLLVSLEELEKIFLYIYADLEKTFHTAICSAQEATETEAQRLTVIELENEFKTLWPYLKVVVDALIYHAVFAEENTQKRKRA